MQLQGQVKLLQPKQASNIDPEKNNNPQSWLQSYANAVQTTSGNPLTLDKVDTSTMAKPPAAQPSSGSPATNHNQRQSQQEAPSKVTLSPKQTMAHGPHMTAGVTHITHKDGQHTTLLHKGRNITSEAADKALAGRMLPPTPNERTRNPTQSTHGLRGVRQERGSPFYLQQIAIDNDETDEEIGNMVKDHCKEKGIRVMKYRIFRYRAVYDTVGCRIIIPESQEHLALNPNTWPADVTCRRWKSAGTWIRERQAEQEKNKWGDDNYRDSNRDEYQGDRYGKDRNKYDDRYNDNRRW